MKKTNRIISPKRPSLSIAIALVLCAIALFLLKDSIFDNRKNVTDINTILQPSPQQPAGQNTPQATAPAPDAPTVSVAPETPEPPPPPRQEAAPASASCQKVTDDLLLFFKQLDSQEYIKAYTQKEPVQKSLTDIVVKLLNNPPVNERETADLLTVLKNAAHFFRVLGIKDLSLLREIITNEHSSLEQQLATLYAWSTMEKECANKSPIQIHLPLAKTYEYAAFFLNTLGGQAYLSRRDPTLRILTRYYSVLILNQANQQSLNKYSLDLAYHLKAVIRDISNSDFLTNQVSYLDTLKKITIGR
ncbi:MAG: hypothetical protein PHI06_04265 [Desulfobulbaceae bacterium]|nr:hypothetical protein [Desulfobulbaceae bacterium]